MKSRIPYAKPSITDLETKYATDAAKNGWGEQCYAYIEQFEEAFKNFLGVRYAIATSSCTGALHMGMAALGIGPGDEVILADANWIATVAPVVHLGAQPIFVDIRADTWCLDPQKIEEAITPKTKAIVAVHLYGNLCDMAELRRIGANNDIHIIEDAAEAIGSIYHGNKAGSMGTFGAFSFHGSKTITTGEGGMFVTNDKDLYERVLTLSNHGRALGENRQFWPQVVGFKYKMSNIQAALGCAQLHRINDLVTRKREILASYRERLQNFPEIRLNHEEDNTTVGAWIPNAVFADRLGVTRDALQSAFEAENIDARVFFWPLSSLPAFGGNTPAAVASSIASRAINLPSFHDITALEIDRVTDTLLAILRTKGFEKCG